MGCFSSNTVEQNKNKTKTDNKRKEEPSNEFPIKMQTKTVDSKESPKDGNQSQNKLMLEKNRTETKEKNKPENNKNENPKVFSNDAKENIQIKTTKKDGIKEDNKDILSKANMDSERTKLSNKIVRFNKNIKFLYSYDFNYFLYLSNKGKLEDILDIVRDILVNKYKEEPIIINNDFSFNHLISFDSYKLSSQNNNKLLDFNYIQKINNSLYEQLKTEYNLNCSYNNDLITSVLNYSNQDITIYVMEKTKEESLNYGIEKVESLIKKYSQRVKKLHFIFTKGADNFLKLAKTIIDPTCFYVEKLLIAAGINEAINFISKNNFQFKSLKDFFLYLAGYNGNINVLAKIINQCKNLENLILVSFMNLEDVINLLNSLTLNENLKVYIIVESSGYGLLNQSKLGSGKVKYVTYIRVNLTCTFVPDPLSIMFNKSVGDLKGFQNNLNVFTSYFENYHLDFKTKLNCICVIKNDSFDQQINSIKNIISNMENSINSSNKISNDSEKMKNYLNSDDYYKQSISGTVAVFDNSGSMCTFKNEQDIKNLMDNNHNIDKIQYLTFQLISSDFKDWNLVFDPLKNIIPKMDSFYNLTFIIGSGDCLVENFIKGFPELIPYLNKTKTLLNINFSLSLIDLPKNILDFITNLFRLLKNAVSYSFNFSVVDGNALNYEDIKKFINNVGRLKKEKIFDNLYEIEIKHPKMKEILNMNDFKECLSDLLLGYPKLTLLNE